MSESMLRPWIRDYFTDVAETHGSQLYNAQVSSKKKRVQLTDFLTYQGNSYIWAWVSDKDYKVTVRISKNAVDKYKSTHNRNIVDSRFFPVFVSDYRPMFSPRPLGPNAVGNTPVSHLSLEVDCVSMIGTGGHLFGNPCDLELDDNLKEWVLGLRQDGGGGNVLKLRKQQEPVQNEKAPQLPPLALPLASHDRVNEVVKDTVKPKPEQPRDFKREYAKRWRIIEADPWKFAIKPAVEERPIQPRNPPVEPLVETKSRLESPHHESLECPATPRRTPLPTSLRRQGTPTDWSPSNRGSPVAPDVVNSLASGNEIQQHDKSKALPTTSHPPSDTEGHATAITSDTHSLQPPTPAQRIKRSPIRHSSLPRSSPEPFAHSPPRPSQPVPHSSPPLPSSSLPLPSSSLSIPMGIRKNIQRKVPHPGLHVPPPDPTKCGPVQILVPNSDTSGTGSSQSYSQLLHLSQSQQYQSQLLSHSSNFSSSLAKVHQFADASKPINASRHTSKMFAGSSPILGDDDERELTSAGDKYNPGEADVNIGKKSESYLPPSSNAPKIEVLEEGMSDTEETEVLQLGHGDTQTVGVDTPTGIQDTGEVDANTDHEDGGLTVNKVDAHSTLQSPLPGRHPGSATASVIHHPSPAKEDPDEVAIRRSSQSPERSGSQSPMYSLFSDSLADERGVFLNASVNRTQDLVQEKASPSYVPGHDSEAWKAPSFMARNKGKGKTRAVEELVTPSVKVGKKRRQSVEPESPGSKRAKDTVPEAHPGAPGPTVAGILCHVEPEASSVSNTHPSNRGSTSHKDTTEMTTDLRVSKSRLANFAVDFERINLGKRVPIPRLDLDKDIRSILLRTGRIRTLGNEVEDDGRVYIMG